MAEKIRVLIADDHPIFRAGVRQVLEKDKRLVIVAEAENGEEAFQKMTELKPDVAVIDIHMPKMTGLEVARRADATGLTTNIILLTMLDDKRVFLEAMETGVKGYVLKDSAASEIPRAVAAVCEERHYISPTLSGLLVQKKTGPGEAPPALKNLTPAEIHVLRLIADLKSNQEIADELFISRRTVENHRVNIAKKLGLSGSNALLKFALLHKSDL